MPAGESAPQTRSEVSGSSSRDVEQVANGTPSFTGTGKIDAEITEKDPGKTTSATLQKPSEPLSSLRSRPSRRSTVEEGSEHTSEIPNSAEKTVRDQVEEQGLIRRTPVYRSPVRGNAERWHEEVDTPSQWTSLFYGVYEVKFVIQELMSRFGGCCCIDCFWIDT